MTTAKLVTTIANLQDQKRLLRASSRARRDGLNMSFRGDASAAACRNAIGVLAGRKPASMAAFVAIQSEIDPTGVLAWAHAAGVATALPATIGAEDVVFRRFRAGDPLVVGEYGTMTPADSAPVLVPDALIVPLLAFDVAGRRLGYGAGYYDRAIKKFAAVGRRPFLLGVSFSAQEVQHVPTEPHDAYLDAVATERSVISCGARE